MGTRSRIVIKRRTKPHIYFWEHWNGDFEGVGSRICEALHTLLHKYDLAGIQNLIEAKESGDVFWRFEQTQDLVDFIEGGVEAYSFCDGDDYLFAYLIDPYEERVRGRNLGEVFTDVTFAQIKKGVTFTSPEESDQDYEIVERRRLIVK